MIEVTRGNRQRVPAPSRPYWNERTFLFRPIRRAMSCSMKFTRAIPVLVMVAAVVCRANAADADSPESSNSLSEHAGIYAYRGGTTVAISAKKGRLIAVLDESPYQLTRVDGDAFKNGVGQPIAFRREPSGVIAGSWKLPTIFPAYRRKFLQKF